MQPFEMHLYCCHNCIVTFGVEAAFEDQSSVICPVCGTDHMLEDAGGGTFELKHLPEEVES